MNSSAVRLRFAPSPTGPLHIGGARTALFNYLFAKRHSGVFILRIDDTDSERSKPEFEQDILASMRWLGLDWDIGPDKPDEFGPYRQTECFDRYMSDIEKLLSSGLAYRDDGAVRLKYGTNVITVPDLVCGDARFAVDSLGPDPVILRSNGVPTYHLASVSDDIAMKISHVVRGQDHLTNTAKHVVLFRALGAEPPVFAHLPLILGEDKTKLSKRNSEDLITVGDFRRDGFLPEALNNFLALLGWSHPDGQEQLDLEELISSFSFDRVGNTASVFERSKLSFLNGWWLRELSAEEVANRAIDFTGEFKELIEKESKSWWIEVIETFRSGFSRLSDAEELAKLLFSLEFPLSDAATAQFSEHEAREQAVPVLEAWLESLRELPLQPDRDCYTAEQFSQVVASLKKSVTGPKKILFQALRVAVTGDIQGPELKHLVEFTKREALVSRAETALEQVRAL